MDTKDKVEPLSESLRVTVEDKFRNDFFGCKTLEEALVVIDRYNMQTTLSPELPNKMEVFIQAIAPKKEGLKEHLPTLLNRIKKTTRSRV